mgnify:CR=1 FL=1
MIPLVMMCTISGCLDVPIITSIDTVPEAIINEYQRQNPKKTKNPSCYVMGEFYVECPEVNYD